MEDKRRQAFLLQHEHYCQIWQLVKSGELEILEGSNRILGQLMLEHPQYQYFWELPAAFAYEQAREAIEEQRGVNPVLHIAVEADVLAQIEAKDPPEASKAYASFLQLGLEPAEACHAIMRILSELVWEMSRGKRYKKDAYIRRLRRAANYPQRVYNEQIRKMEENL